MDAGGGHEAAAAGWEGVGQVGEGEGEGGEL